ncbi:MAG TPA: PAS domain-containing protein [Azospirillum sp.]|nr:PAS domain-containing protein [Azospirillum sp.]
MAASKREGRLAEAPSGMSPADLSAAGGTLFEAMPVPVFVRDAGGAYIGCNNAFTATYGSPADLEQGTDLDALLGDAPACTVREARLKRRDGAMRDVLLHLNRFGDVATGLGGMIGVVVDVTDHKQAERDLAGARSETETTRHGLEEATIKLEEAYRTGRLGYWEYGIHTGKLVWSEGAFEIFGQNPETFEPTFDHLLEILHPDDRLRYGNMLESVIANPKRVYVEFRASGADGRTRCISSSCAPRYDRNGRLTHVFGVMLNTTEQAEAAAQLQAAKQRLEEAHRTGRLGYWEYGIHTGKLELNDEAFAIYGQSAETFEPTFDGLLNILHPDDRLRFGNMLEDVIGNSKRVYFEYRVIDPVGEVRYVSSSCAPRFDADGRLTQVFGVMLDTTERALAAAALRAAKEEAEHALAELRAAQDSLVQSEKMASLGALVAGVAHEINGPVGVALTTASHIAGRTEDLRRQLHGGTITRSALAGYLDEACEASHLLVTNTERIAALVQMFKQVSADQTGDERRTFYLRDYIEDVLLSLHMQIGPSGHQVTMSCPDALQVESYPGAFARVLTHLVRNALQHAFRPEQNGRIVITVEPVGEDWIKVRHADDGRGIDAADLPKVFDPFFTTARHAGGVGLGLHIAYNLTTQTLGGQLLVESRVGEGTAFTLRIPRVAP